MSKVYDNDYGVFISHEKYINAMYEDVNGKRLQLNPNLFNISSQYNSNKKAKMKNDNYDCSKHETLHTEQEEIKHKFSNFLTEFKRKTVNHRVVENELALKTAQFVYSESGKALVNNAYGANIGPATVKKINDSNFIFPQNSTFFSKDISNIEKDLSGRKYDLIVLDPPWWNKYIRRKRKKSGDAYEMLFNDSLKNIPIDNLLKEDGMVVIWCTNSLQNLNDLLLDVFPKWGIQFCGKWFWMKITTAGEPVCNFSRPPGKQPYEQIIFGCRKYISPSPFNNNLVVSVPSAIHSHKPPLVELLKPFLPENPSCLEIFARYLLPGWTSYGNEVLRLQHESLFVTV